MEKKNNPDVSFIVNMTKDKMEAFLQLNKPGIEIKDEEINQIINEIEKQQIKLQISKQELVDKIKVGTAIEKIPIAKGKPPINGRDGYYEIHYQNKKDGKPSIQEDGRVDFYNLDFVTNVREGELLATVHPPTEGVEGETVTGLKVPFKPGKNPKIPLGKNVSYDEETHKITSNISGQLSIMENKINVHDVLEVKNVDFKTGNIDFVGNVVVNEGVRDGFTIKAEGDVTVKGHVDSAFIFCGGNLTVNGGIQGRNKGRVEAQGNVIARYIENCEVKSSESVIVKDAIMHSKVYANQKVIASEGKGLIVGGVVGTGKEIIANTIGSHLATQTELEVGVNPELRGKLQQLTKELSKENDDLKKSKQAMKLLKLKEEQLGQLPPAQKSMLIRLSITIKHLEKTLEEKKELQQEMLEQLMSSSEGTVKANKIVYSGVKVTIGTRYRNITDRLSSPTFVIGEDGEVSII